MLPVAVASGAIVGLSLGLTGGGGAIFAVPLLVSGMAVDPRQAVEVSLAAVGTMAAVGFALRRRAGQVEIAPGLTFAATGMIGAPIGAWLSFRVPETLLLSLFAVLAAVVALRMWRQAAAIDRPFDCASVADDASTCRRDAQGNLLLNTPCAMVLGLVGVLTGMLSGLFGVGGGFVIVPALVLFSGMAMHRAVGTSLLIIALTSAAGVAAQLAWGRKIPLELASYFVAGGVAGMLVGTMIARRLSGPTLQRTFAAAIAAVALFVIVRTWGTS